MANDEIQIDGAALKAAVSSLTSRKSKSKAGLSERKTTIKKTATKKTTANKKSTASEKSGVKKGTSTKAKTTAKKTTAKKSSTTSTAGSRGLAADIKKNEGESYTRAELMDGIRIVVQEAGMEAIQKTVIALVTNWTPMLGEKLEKDAVNLIIRKTKGEYSKASAEQKKSLRAVIHWIRNDFDLGKSLDASEFITGFTDNGNASTSSTPLNLKPLNEK